MKRLLLFTLLSLGSIHLVNSQNSLKELPSGYFMVLSAYAPSYEHYAISYTKTLQEKGIEADYGFSYSKQLYFVYSKKFDSRSEAIRSISAERERTGEDRAWVYVYEAKDQERSVAKTDEKPVEEEVMAEPAEQPVEEKVVETGTEPETEPEPAPETESDTIQIIAGSDTLSIRKDIPVSHQGITYLHAEAFDARTGQPIDLDFQVIDLTRNTLMAEIESNKSYPIREPNSSSKMIQVQSDDIGWQKQSFDFQYYTPVIDPISIFLDNLGDTTFVKFEMNPIRKGDIVTLYKVFFYKDAAIMMDNSMYELDQLVASMENNPTMKIIIHGHTNGKAAGDIIALKDHDDVDFFNINGDHKQMSGSAKKLSYERAKIVGRYLESKGIDPSRFEIKGWGGKKMLYDKNSPKARYNVRVDIEVAED